MNIVYLTENLINGKKYIGSHSTSDLDDDYIGSGKALLASIRKYGKNNFKKTIIEECLSTIDARKLEKIYIEKYKTLVPCGYNISPSGGYGYNLGEISEETREKISVSQKIRLDGKIVKHKEETKKKISDSNKNKPKSESHKESLKIAWSKRRVEHPVTEETKQKMKETSKGKINIKSYKITDPQGKIYITDEGLTKFCEEHELKTPLMCKVSKGERKHHKGWKCDLLK